MRQFVVISALILLWTSAISAQNIAELSSPGHKISCYVQYVNNNLAGVLNLNGMNSEVVKLDFGLVTNIETIGKSSDVFISSSTTEYNGVITSNISERKNTVDRYTETILKFKSPKDISYNITLRLYDEGVAVKYDISSSTQVAVTSDRTSVDLSSYSPYSYKEAGYEKGYAYQS